MYAGASYGSVEYGGELPIRQNRKNGSGLSRGKKTNQNTNIGSRKKTSGLKKNTNTQVGISLV